MKRILLILMPFVVTATLSAQGLSVSGFNLLDTDITAITQGTQEIDQNGDVAALIKVVTRETGFAFDIGAPGIVKTRQAVGEIWVYVPKHAQKISIFHQQYGVLRNYYFPVPIESGRTYELKLEVQKEEPQVIEKNVEKTVTLSNEEGLYKSNLALAESGDAAAQYYVGYALYKGIGVEQNYEEAVTWLEKAADQDDSRAQYYLGLCYENGTGVEKDEAKAVKLYSKAGLSQALAAYRLGYCYYKGIGVAQDFEKAHKAFQQATTKNVPEAMFQLGNMYYNGEGVTRNYKDAVNWYNTAAEAGNVEAMCALGHCYKLGKGVKADKYMAIIWYERAAEQGSEETRSYLGDSYVPPKSAEKKENEAVTEPEKKDGVEGDDGTEEDVVYYGAEVKPEFPGGKEALLMYLKRSIRYPTVSLERGAQGSVVVQFVVDKDGSITDIEVIKSVDPDLDKEAIRVVQGMPKWVPGMQNGKPVRAKYTLPITFKYTPVQEIQMNSHQEQSKEK